MAPMKVVVSVVALIVFYSSHVNCSDEKKNQADHSSPLKSVNSSSTNKLTADSAKDILKGSSSDPYPLPIPLHSNPAVGHQPFHDYPSVHHPHGYSRSHEEEEYGGHHEYGKHHESHDKHLPIHGLEHKPKEILNDILKPILSFKPEVSYEGDDDHYYGLDKKYAEPDPIHYVKKFIPTLKKHGHHSKHHEYHEEPYYYKKHTKRYYPHHEKYYNPHHHHRHHHGKHGYHTEHHEEHHGHHEPHHEPHEKFDPLELIKPLLGHKERPHYRHYHRRHKPRYEHMYGPGMIDYDKYKGHGLDISELIPEIPDVLPKVKSIIHESGIPNFKS